MNKTTMNNTLVWVYVIGEMILAIAAFLGLMVMGFLLFIYSMTQSKR